MMTPNICHCFTHGVCFVFVLLQVLGHLGFDFEDENGMPVQGSTESKRSPAKCISSRGASQYLSWGGASAMSFEV